MVRELSYFVMIWRSFEDVLQLFSSIYMEKTTQQQINT